MAAQQIGEVGRVGGWRGHPNSLAVLARHRVPIDQQRRCKRCGKLPAVRGQDQCRMHLGGWSPLSPAGGRAESRLLCRLERAGLLSPELLALPVWRKLTGITTAKRAPARLALVLAWDKRFRAPLHWAQAQRRAIDLAMQPGRRQYAVGWYENY